MMNIRWPLRLLMIPLLIAANYVGVSVPAFADDTEIFFNSPASQSSAGRPKVLVIFDDSGSMDTIVQTRPPYDPSRRDYAGGVSSGNLDRIYWSTNGEPPSAGSNQWFEPTQNRCESSYAGLSNQGFFATKARRWQASGSQTSCTYDACPSGYFAFGGVCVRFFPFNVITRSQTCTTTDVPGEWRSLSTSVHTPPHVDCEADVTSSEPGNGPSVADGYPKDDVLDADVYSASTPGDSDVDWGNTAYTLFTGNYVDYWNDATLLSSDSRINIAQQVISDMITANTGLDFGLATFNGNPGNGPSDHNGGRILKRIIENMPAADRVNLVSTVNSLTTGGWTPLCESYYEVHRYLTGRGVVYGDDRDTGGTPDRDLPARDTSAEDGSGNYIAPPMDCGPVYVILMTDGLPTNDTAANSLIKALPGISSCDDWATDSGGVAENCLPELSHWMNTNDLDGDASNGDQFAITYTIGFDTSQPLLEATATFEDGYFEADSADTLTAAFSEIVNNILTIESTFTSPAVAVDTFTRTQSRDDVFYAMFKPDNRVNWSGNVKKLKLRIENDAAILIDKNGDPAIDPTTGYILGTADTYWSSNDGGLVEAGGVGGRLAARDPSSRTVLSNTADDGSLEAFNSTNVTWDAFDDLGISNASELYAHFGVNSQDLLETVLNWAQGYKIAPDGSVSAEKRDWIMGDPLHSQPLILNYGALGSATLVDPDLRIVVGTNSGFLHMFGNSDGEEDWAFFPKELGGILNQRRINNLSNDHVYGVDLTPTVYTVDIGKDGTLDASDNDLAWLYLGLRRGGRQLYALDVSNPNSPEFLWSKRALPAGAMAELGQTWSKPVVTKIPGYLDNNGVPKPVVIVGAGYDTNKDSSAVGTADSMGRGVYIFDAEDGTLVRRVTPAANSFGLGGNLQATGLTDSVPGQVATLDSNADGLTDRLYFADTGGNLWRVDINVGLPSFPDGETWYLTKIATLGGATTATDRRFFNKPDIVRVRDFDGEAVDALLIGSGDRTNPSADDVNNFFYLVRDRMVISYTTDHPSTADCTGPDPVMDFRCSLPFDQSDMLDMTNPLLVSNDETVREAARQALDAAPGWKYPLSRAGEKNLSDSITFGGFVAFTTYTPPGIITGANACEPVLGDGALYFVDIRGGDRKIIPLGPIIPDTPSPHVGSDGKVRFILPPGTPPGASDPNDPIGCGDGVCDLFQTFPGAEGNYWYREEY